MSLPGNSLPPLPVAIRPMTPGCLPYVRSAWLEGYKQSAEGDRMPWPLYKQTVGRTVAKLLDRSDVHLVGAYHDKWIAGWIAYTPGRLVTTVHWVHTRFKLPEGDACRHRGVMTSLFSAVGLGKRVAYTFRGPRRRNGARRNGRGSGSDEWIVEWLKQRGVNAVYVGVDEFLK